MQPFLKLNAPPFRSLPALNCLVICLSHVFVNALLYCCLKKNHCADKDHLQNHNPTLPTLFQFAQKGLTTPELRHCLFVCECLVFASPLVMLCVKPLLAFLTSLYACVGYALIVCMKVDWSVS